MNNVELLVIAGLLSVMAACSSQPVYMDSSFDSEPNYQLVSNKANFKGSCNFKLSAVTDERRSKHSLGSVAINRVYSNDIVSWLENGLGSIGITRNHDEELVNDNVILVNFALLVAYAKSISTSKTTNVVVRFSAKYKNDSVLERDYRGSDVSVNWASGKSEIKASFNRSLSKLLSDIKNDTDAFCRELLLSGA